MRLTGGARPLERLAVGVADHQHFAGERALSDDGDESIVPEAHGLNPILGGRGGHVRKIPALTRIVKMPLGRVFCVAYGVSRGCARWAGCVALFIGWREGGV